MAGPKGFAFRAVDMGHGYSDPGMAQVSVGKTLPQTATGNLFTVTGSIQGVLTGFVATALGAVAQHLSIGVTGNSTALAGPSAVALNATVQGAVIVLPQVLGAALPAPVIATAPVHSANLITFTNVSITLTSDASTTGAITWVLHWVGLGDDQAASVVSN